MAKRYHKKRFSLFHAFTALIVVLLVGMEIVAMAWMLTEVRKDNAIKNLSQRIAEEERLLAEKEKAEEEKRQQELKKEVASKTAVTNQPGTSTAAQQPEPAPSAPAPAPKPVSREEQLMSVVEIELNKGLEATAIERLIHIKSFNPEFSPAMMKLATIYEDRGRFQEAITEWEGVIRLGTSDPNYITAVYNKKRVESEINKWKMAAQLDIDTSDWEKPIANRVSAIPRNSPQKEPEQPLAQEETTEATSRVTVPTQNPSARIPVPETPKTVSPKRSYLPRIQVLNTELIRNAASDAYDEMRLLTITILGDENQSIPGSAVRIEVQFYDQYRSSQRLVPTEAVVVPQSQTLEGTLRPKIAKNVTVSYTIPKGQKRAWITRAEGRRVFKGYHIDVFYRDELVTSTNHPPALPKLLEQN